MSPLTMNVNDLMASAKALSCTRTVDKAYRLFHRLAEMLIPLTEIIIARFIHISELHLGLNPSHLELIFVNDIAATSDSAQLLS
jgi:hypothetical protein